MQALPGHLNPYGKLALAKAQQIIAIMQAIINHQNK